VIKARGVEIKGHFIFDAFKMFALAYGLAFLVLTLLNRNETFKLLAENSTWLPKYIGDSLAFLVTMIMIWRISQGNFREYGFTLKGRDLKLKASLALGVFLALLGILDTYLPDVISAGSLVIEPAHPYPLTVVNILGMMSFQWIFVGIFEEPLARGLVQTYLMNKMKGTISIFKWDFHIGTVITAILFGVGHFGPHIFFGGSWLSLIPHLIFATLFGLAAGYIYQETKSLAGPILMHNIVDGLLYSFDYLFY
jgi:membrane protease YdiL (CAAX protease family)